MRVRTTGIALLMLGLFNGCAGSTAPAESPSAKPDSDSTAEPSEDVGGPPPGTPPELSELIGTWRPVTLFGVDVREIRRIHGDRVTLMFTESQAGLQVSAYDGCNWVGARVRLQPSGRFSASERAQTLRGCLPSASDRETRNAEVVTTASRMLRRGARLLFLDSRHELIAEYIRTRPGP